MEDQSPPWGTLEIISDNDIPFDLDPDQSGSWRRGPDEYIPGTRRYNLVTMDRARYTHKDSDLELDQRTEYLHGIRGNLYHPGAYSDTRLRGEVWFEIVPEPSNPFDPHALALDLNGVRAGYIGARAARYYQWLIRVANSEGTRCFAPGFVAHPTSSWVVLPTLKTLEEVIQTDEPLEILRTLIKSLPEQLLSQIESDNFHISVDTASGLLQFRDRAPFLFPSVPEPAAFSPAWDLVLKEAKLDRNEELIRRRASILAEAEAVKAAQRQRRKEERKIRLNKVSDLLTEEKSTREISQSLGISQSVVRSIARELKLPLPGSGENEYSRRQRQDRVIRCIRAYDLQSKGIESAEIAIQLGVSLKSVKVLLTDGRFYREPSKYVERLALARKAADEGWTSSIAKEHGKQAVRAVRDAQALAQLSTEWLSNDN